MMKRYQQRSDALYNLHNIVLIQSKFLDKREKMDSEEDSVDIIFMNSINSVYAITALQKEIILLMQKCPKEINF